MIGVGRKVMSDTIYRQLVNYGSTKSDIPSQLKLKNDLISRQQAIDAVDVKCLHRGIVKGIQGIIEDLPSAQPQRKKGKWIYHSNWEADGECGYECSECGMGSDVDYNYCMRCGARMVKEGEEHD